MAVEDEGMNIPDLEHNDLVLECDITESRSDVECEDSDELGTGENSVNTRYVWFQLI